MVIPVIPLIPPYHLLTIIKCLMSSFKYIKSYALHPPNYPFPLQPILTPMQPPLSKTLTFHCTANYELPNQNSPVFFLPLLTDTVLHNQHIPHQPLPLSLIVLPFNSSSFLKGVGNRPACLSIELIGVSI